MAPKPYDEVKLITGIAKGRMQGKFVALAGVLNDGIYVWIKSFINNAIEMIKIDYE